MEDNLIENIKKAEQEAADIIAAAEKNTSEKLKDLERDHVLHIERMEEKFQNDEDEIIKRSKSDGEVYKEKNSSILEKEIVSIKEKALQEKSSMMSFVLEKIFGMG